MWGVMSVGEWMCPCVHMCAPRAHMSGCVCMCVHMCACAWVCVQVQPLAVDSACGAEGKQSRQSLIHELGSILPIQSDPLSRMAPPPSAMSIPSPVSLGQAGVQPQPLEGNISGARLPKESPTPTSSPVRPGMGTISPPRSWEKPHHLQSGWLRSQEPPNQAPAPAGGHQSRGKT